MRFSNIDNIKRFIRESKTRNKRGLSLFDSIWRIILLLLAYFVVTIIITLLVMNFLIHKVGTVIMPDVNGKQFVNAYIELKNLNLNVNPELRYYDNISFGIVTSQSISPGCMIKEKRTVKLVISGGKVSETNVIKESKKYNSTVIRTPIPSYISSERVRVVIISSNGNRNTVYQDVVKGGEVLSVPIKYFSHSTSVIYLGTNEFRRDILK